LWSEPQPWNALITGPHNHHQRKLIHCYGTSLSMYRVLRNIW
jgi:hypothetical protein